MDSKRIFTPEQLHYLRLLSKQYPTVQEAGTEIIRRTVGSSKVMELNTVTEPAVRAAMERALVKAGVRFVKERESLRTGEDAAAVFRAVLAE